MSRDMIKEAEKNVIRIAKTWEDALSFCDALNNFGNTMCNEYIGRQEFFEGLHKIRSAMYKEYVTALSRCFCFVGVGGEDAKNYSKERFEKVFSNKQYEVMSFLDKFGHCPSSYKDHDEKEFRKQIDEKLEEKE